MANLTALIFLHKSVTKQVRIALVSWRPHAREP
jgi:hypothetical protein